MEVARNPSDENIKNWISYIDKKNELAERLRNRIADFSLKNQQPKFAELAAKTIAALPKGTQEIDPSRFRIRTYFESTCPHCRNMMKTLRSLQEDGIFVEALQIDPNTVSESEFPIATSRADPSDVKKTGHHECSVYVDCGSEGKDRFEPSHGL